MLSPLRGSHRSQSHRTDQGSSKDIGAGLSRPLVGCRNPTVQIRAVPSVSASRPRLDVRRSQSHRTDQGSSKVNHRAHRPFGLDPESRNPTVQIRAVPRSIELISKDDRDDRVAIPPYRSGQFQALSWQQLHSLIQSDVAIPPYRSGQFQTLVRLCRRRSTATQKSQSHRTDQGSSKAHGRQTRDGHDA